MPSECTTLARVGASPACAPLPSVRASLEEAGADVTYREIENLSHTYPREVNGEIADWLMR